MAFHAEDVQISIDPGFIAIMVLAVLVVAVSLLWWKMSNITNAHEKVNDLKKKKDQESQSCAEINLTKVLLVEDLRRSGVEKLLRATGRQVPRQRKTSSVEEVENLIDDGKLELIMRIV